MRYRYRKRQEPFKTFQPGAAFTLVMREFFRMTLQAAIAADGVGAAVGVGGHERLRSERMHEIGGADEDAAGLHQHFVKLRPYQPSLYSMG
ncbi:MAG: hypothetical protein LAQ69_37870 [Acidobacteriia bacterium]|nr:hypothetical protein [Terriglobia bacterium]